MRRLCDRVASTQPARLRPISQLRFDSMTRGDAYLEANGMPLASVESTRLLGPLYGVGTAEKTAPVPGQSLDTGEKTASEAKGPA